jgi:hypothetical protein
MLNVGANEAAALNGEPVVAPAVVIAGGFGHVNEGGDTADGLGECALVPFANGVAANGLLGVPNVGIATPNEVVAVAADADAGLIANGAAATGLLGVPIAAPAPPGGVMTNGLDAAARNGFGVAD